MLLDRFRNSPAATPGYRELADQYRETLLAQVTFNLHVGVEDGDAAVRAFEHLRGTAEELGCSWQLEAALSLSEGAGGSGHQLAVARPDRPGPRRPDDDRLVRGGRRLGRRPGPPSAPERGQDAFGEGVEEVAGVGPDVVQIDLVEAHLGIGPEPGDVPGEVGGDPELVPQVFRPGPAVSRSKSAGMARSWFLDGSTVAIGQCRCAAARASSSSAA